MQTLGGQGAPEIGGDVRRRRLRQGVGPAFAVGGKTVGRQAAEQGQPLQRLPGVLGVLEQRRPFVRRQRRSGPCRRRRQEGRPRPKPQPRSKTPRTTNVYGEARLIATPRRLLGWYGACATMSRVELSRVDLEAGHIGTWVGNALRVLGTQAAQPKHSA